MSIDTLDQMFVNSPLKKLMLKYFEFLIFKKFLHSQKIILKNKTILEAGCGAGYGLKLIFQTFNPKYLYGFDILPEEVLLAKKKNIPAKIFVGDITNIKLPTNSFDAVFAITVLHHVPKYSEALKELNRVLKPGGVLLIDDLNKRAVDIFKIFFGVKHPKKARFEWFEFFNSISSAGFKILKKKLFPIGFGLFLCIKS
ncbi:MAG: class I SAM-dependent methyltransferase [Promethearchaeota archaeon]